MDFPSRNVQTPAPAPAHTAPAGGKRSKEAFSWGRLSIVLGFGAIAVLILAVAGVIAFGGPKAEDSYIDSGHLQAVFLNTGQVYFGNVKALNNKYLVLSNIYYLQTSSGSSTTTAASSNTSVSLVKLGCELHEPLDQMVINRTQVTFWENLGENGQVAKAVSTFEKQNPNGQKCADQSSSASTNSSSATQNAPTTGSSTNSTTTNP